MRNTETADQPPEDLRARELLCAQRGHITVTPTGKATRCLRCERALDDLGLDPRFKRSSNETETR